MVSYKYVCWGGDGSAVRTTGKEKAKVKALNEDGVGTEVKGQYCWVKEKAKTMTGSTESGPLL